VGNPDGCVLERTAELPLTAAQGLFRALALADIPYDRFDALELAVPENGGDDLDGKDIST
jgi:hypothetical protein